MNIPKDTDSYNSLIKYKRLIRKPCISVLAWSKNNFNSSLMNQYTEHNELEKKVINIMSWLDNNSNPSIEKANEILHRKGSFNDAVNTLCTHLPDIKAKELPKKESHPMEDLWNRYMDTKGGQWQAFWSGLSQDEKDYIEVRRQHARDKYYAERGLEDNNSKSLLKG